MITVFGHSQCTYCKQALSFLDEANIENQYIDVRAEGNEEYLDLLIHSGFKTVPQCFEGDTHIGGFDQLQTYVKEQL